MTVRKKLAGELAHLGFGELLHLLDAAGATGRVTVNGPAGTFEMMVIGGKTPRPTSDGLKTLRRLFPAKEGRFRFEQDLGLESDEKLVSLGILEDLSVRAGSAGLSSDLQVEELLQASLSGPLPDAQIREIHQLPAGELEDPMAELVEDLQDVAPEDLQLAQVGVVAADPRLWRGTVEHDWRRRGWELKLLAGPDANLEGIDLVVVHHQLSVTRVGSEGEWLRMVENACSPAVGVPLVWVGPLGDLRWVERLVDAGVSFLLPPPAGDRGEPLERFHAALASIVERLLERGRGGASQRDTFARLAEALFSDGAAAGGVATVLQMAARSLDRAAVIRVEATSFRSVAGFGYTLHEGVRALPRGIAILEHAARGRETVTSLTDPGQGRRQLARLLGVEHVSNNTCVVPLQAGGRPVAVLVGDRQGEDLTDLDDLIRLAPRLGLLLEQ